MNKPDLVSIILAQEEAQMARREPSTDNLDLASLPERLDDETLARVQDIARSPLPPPEPAKPRHFNQCLRVMLAVLPKRSLDEVSGELFVAAYQKKLGHYSDAAISFLADRAMERCQWFPTIAECVEIISDFRRNDEHTERKALAQRIASYEQNARRDDERAWGKINQWSAPELTQADVDKMSEEMKRLGLSSKALVRNGDGTISPWKPDPNAEPTF